ncbi:MAG: FtsW/RodA/SpoVE family cell cycle protein, partial [Planctomycetaceae bacterium]
MSVIHWVSRISWLIVICALALMGWGYHCIVRGDELVGNGTLAERQAMWIGISLPVMWGATLIPYHVFRRFSYGFYAVCLLLLVIVCLMPPINGSRAWIPLGFMNLQPSELSKIAFIMTLAHYLMHRQNYRSWSGLIVPFLLTIVPVLLILKEPDLGSALLFFPVLFAMLFAAGARPRHLVLISLMGAMSLPVIWWQMNAEQRSRIVAVFLQEDGGVAPKGSLYHLHQSKQMLALGGTWGSRWGGMPADDPYAY